MWSVSRAANVSINTVAKLPAEADAACEGFHDKAVRNVPCKRVQRDEIWAFNYCKQRSMPAAKAALEHAGNI